MDILELLDVHWQKAEDNGMYTTSNAIHKASEEIKRLRKEMKEIEQELVAVREIFLRNET